MMLEVKHYWTGETIEITEGQNLVREWISPPHTARQLDTLAKTIDELLERQK